MKSKSQTDIDLDDAETDEILGRAPQPDQPCLECGVIVTDDNDQSVWVRNGIRYSPFCNQFHHDMFFKLGLWADERLKPALKLDED